MKEERYNEKYTDWKPTIKKKKMKTLLMKNEMDSQWENNQWKKKKQWMKDTINKKQKIRKERPNEWKNSLEGRKEVRGKNKHKTRKSKMMVKKGETQILRFSQPWDQDQPQRRLWAETISVNIYWTPWSAKCNKKIWNCIWKTG